MSYYKKKQDDRRATFQDSYDGCTVLFFRFYYRPRCILYIFHRKSVVLSFGYPSSIYRTSNGKDSNGQKSRMTAQCPCYIDHNDRQETLNALK